MNKRTFILPLGVMAALMMASCVTMRQYEELQTLYSQAAKGQHVAKQELQELREENAELVRQNQSMTMTLDEMTHARQQCESALTSMNRAYADLQHRYDTTVENYMQQITGKNRDITKADKLLAQRTRELAEKEKSYAEKERAMLEQQRLLEVRQAQLEHEDSTARQALAAKERELESVRSAVSHALVGFADKGLNVETRDGKVYVSMADKLLFAPGSWTVSKQGVAAIKKLAKVLEENKDLNIMVEGHTDNDAYHGSTAVKDNWDLSVMRATAIVKLLLKEGAAISPARVEAAGHAEYAPKASNTTTAGKAANRRTEIILTPRLGDIMKIVGE